MENEETMTRLKYLGCKNKLMIKMVIWGTFYVSAVLQKTSHILGYLTQYITSWITLYLTSWITISMRCVLRHQFITGETEVQKA